MLKLFNHHFVLDFGCTQIILQKRLAHSSITSLKWYLNLHSDRRNMYKTSIILAVAAILTVTVMTTVIEEQAYASQVGSGFNLVSHPGGHTDQNANGGSVYGSDGGDANGGNASSH
jgi:hypothetical protein